MIRVERRISNHPSVSLHAKYMILQQSGARILTRRRPRYSRPKVFQPFILPGHQVLLSLTARSHRTDFSRHIQKINLLRDCFHHYSRSQNVEEVLSPSSRGKHSRGKHSQEARINNCSLDREATYRKDKHSERNRDDKYNEGKDMRDNRNNRYNRDVRYLKD